MAEAKDHQDMGDGMQCINHPFTKNPGGICAFCLQEKLGNLVTSSFPLPKHFPSSSSSSSPSFRSDSLNTTTASSSLSVAASCRNITNNNNNNKTPFLIPKNSSSSGSASTANIVYKRSQSTTAYKDSDSTPRKRNSFWSFLHLHSTKHYSSNKKVGTFQQTQTQNSKTETTTIRPSSSSSSSSMSKRVVTKELGDSTNTNRNKTAINVIVEENGSPNIVIPAVSRSRSVGCGSRSFSGDFFERITNGFGDCALRRVESHREGNNNNNKGKISNNGVREIVKCGGIFSGFMIMTSSSSSSSSSSSEHQNQNMANGERNRRWGVFASPMRGFTSTTKRGRTVSDSGKNITSNLGSIPSLLVVKS